MTKNNKDRRKKKSSVYSYRSPLPDSRKTLHKWSYKKGLGEQISRLPDTWIKVEM